MNSAPPVWGVFHVWMEATNPAKYKFFIVLHVSGASALGVVVNSEVNTLGDPDRRLPCFAPVPASAHPFLSYDSWADCTRSFTVPCSELADFRGNITRGTAAEVINAVELCRVLPGKTKKLFAAVPLPEA